MNLFIGCSASDYIPSKYVLDCRKFLEGLFEYGHDLEFGGSEYGLMGLAYNIALEKGRNIKAVYPYVYRDGVKNLECEKILTNTINQRTERVIKESDVLIFLPGGFGTAYELMTVLECRRAYEFVKPIIIYNSCGYFDKLLEFFELTYNDCFASRKLLDYYYVCDDVEDVLDYIDRYYCIDRNNDNRSKVRIRKK